MSQPYIKVLNRTDPNRCNCVKYARSKVSSLPYGLWTLWSKKRSINSQKPKKYSVAIMNVGFWGHVGFVKKVGSNHLTIREANYKSCTITERHDTAKALKIIGYYAK
ncbi:MAG: hypothetical protein COX19_10795 [Desulfobacterales bacterium CG23_combo_of_CG06-09_8_20_14_all_51_8]|nr:MAG: hypothetical protein COX19_10795 [Desulfobacterales bacterium CG23_combo_of_CG06-09_8_20_14_all_51_8]